MTTFEERMAAEKAHDKQMNSELETLVEDVAGELGSDWTAVVDPERAVSLRGPLGARIYVRFQGYRNYDRLDLSAANPDSYNYSQGVRGVAHREISVAWGRGAKTTAKEITRRLLPGYLEDLADLHKRIEQANNNATAKQALADELAAVLGVKATDYRGEPSTQVRWYSEPDDVDFNVGYNGTRVRIEGSLSADQALRLATLLATLLAADARAQSRDLRAVHDALIALRTIATDAPALTDRGASRWPDVVALVDTVYDNLH